MPRALTTFFSGFLVLAGILAPGVLGALGVPQPAWTVLAPTEAVAGDTVTVEFRVELPQGYYQDAGSAFLQAEPRSPLVATARSTSAPAMRDGKPSFTGHFTLSRSFVVPANTPAGPFSVSFDLGWQICQLDGVCLLPGQRVETVKFTVSGSTGLPGPAFWAALAGAFLGGLLLNFMPCVFPVLALKGLALASASGWDRRTRRRHALAYSAGTVAAVFALGVGAAGMALAGQRLDWGFAFQQPAFVWVLVLAFWALTLHLAGVWTWRGFSFTISGPGQPGAWGSFLGGAFLVVTAAPCTAPLLGPALGFALGQPPPVILGFFAAIGLGMASPLLVLQAFPEGVRILPRPGPWMKLVERGAAALLGATVVYLLWIFTVQTGINRALPAVGLLVLAGVGLALTSATDRHRLALPGAILAGLLLFGASVALVAPPSSVPRAQVAEGWTAFSPEALERTLAEGKPVLVDATAAWCATCQVNELAVLNRPDVRALMEDLGLVLLRADYTLPDPTIHRWLASVDRAGLPVYALYRPGRPVYLFPELLTDGNFTSQLAALVTP